MIELRWVERGFGVRVLQYRTYHGTHFKDERLGKDEGWSDWTDVPVEVEK